jgi:ubiquinone/menaquinone biosynthesis C-methylase UbiE
MKPGLQKPDSFFDHFSSHYEEYLEDPIKAWLGGDSSEYFLRLKADEIGHHLRRLGLRPKELTVLDVGCGTGLVARMLHNEFAQLHGVDSSKGMIEKARSLSLTGVSFQLSEAGQLPFEMNRFDIIYSMSLFHHVPPRYRLSVIQEMVRVLKLGGWILNFEHNALNPLTRIIVKRCPVDQGVKLLRAREMTHLYEQSNLHRVHTRFILFFPKYFTLLRSLESSLFWLPMGGQFYVCGRKLR